VGTVEGCGGRVRWRGPVGTVEGSGGYCGGVQWVKLRRVQRKSTHNAHKDAQDV